jgi:hypothetical protein
MSVFTNSLSDAPDQAREYTAAILGLLGDRDPFDVLRTTSDGLRAAVAGATERELSAPEAPGKWSMRHVARHLADSEIVWGWRLRLVLGQDRPTITGYDQDAWAARLRYDAADLGESLDEFAVLRRSNLRLLSQTTPEDRARVGVHSERGEESVAHMIRMYAGHDLLHLHQLARIRAAVADR